MASQAKVSRIAINRILLATDFSPESQNAFYCASSLAKRYGSTLLLTHVLSPEGSSGADKEGLAPTDAVRHNVEKKMADLENTPELKSISHHVIIRAGDTWHVIAQVMADKNVDLIVMGTHSDEGIKKLLRGSTAESVNRHATCPVLTVGPHAEFTLLTRLNHILYATDFSSGSFRALIYALTLADEDGADLTLLHVIESKATSESELLEWKRQDREKMLRMTQDRERLLGMVPSDIDLAHQPQVEIEIGLPEIEIVRLAEIRKADLIVMGCHLDGALSTHTPWTTLHHVLRNAHCPVLTVCGE
ncbi:MAG: universal stress protein [Terracidiphilus sp.]